EAGPSLFVEGHDLAVENGPPVGEHLGDPGELGVAGGDLLEPPALHRPLAAARIAEGPHAVPLDLIRPLVPLRLGHFTRLGEHRLKAARHPLLPRVGRGRRCARASHRTARPTWTFSARNGALARARSRSGPPPPSFQG